MTIAFDHHDINHMIISITREMTPRSDKRPIGGDTVFMGGVSPNQVDQAGLANLGLSKNYNIIFPSFDPRSVGDGPVTFHAVVTDGLTQAAVLTGGRLWKRDRRSPAILLFPEFDAVLRLSAKGRLIIREMVGQYHDHGYELALETVRVLAARRPGKVAILSTVGSMPTVLDIETMTRAMQNA